MRSKSNSDYELMFTTCRIVMLVPIDWLKRVRRPFSLNVTFNKQSSLMSLLASAKRESPFGT